MNLTKENALVVIALLQGVTEGKRIEFRNRGNSSGKWEITRNTGFDLTNFEYRIKPEPRTILVEQVHNDGSITAYTEDSKYLATHRSSKSHLVKFVEVIE